MIKFKPKSLWRFYKVTAIFTTKGLELSCSKIINARSEKKAIDELSKLIMSDSRCVNDKVIHSIVAEIIH